MSTFVGQYAAARKAGADARAALDTAHKHLTPPTAEMHELFLTVPGRYAECLRKMADIAESLPALIAAATAAADAETELADQACWYCRGTGEYSAPTSAYRNGKPYCFKCDGTGMNARARKVAA